MILVYPRFDLLLIVLLVAVAVQQPYAMQWSLTNAASPAAIALGKNLQTRLVGYGSGFCQRFDRAPALLRRSILRFRRHATGVPIQTTTNALDIPRNFGISSTNGSTGDRPLPPTPRTRLRSSPSNVGTVLSPPTFPSIVPKSLGLAVAPTVSLVFCCPVACTSSRPHTSSLLCWAGTSRPLQWRPLSVPSLSSPRLALRVSWPSPSFTTV